MKANWGAVVAGAVGLVVGCDAAKAQNIGYHADAVNIALHGAVSVQDGSVQGAQKDFGAKDVNVDGYLRLIGDWTSSQGWLVGASLETSTRRTTQSLRSGEAYVYFSSALGRVEVGRQYGAANSLAFHAPDIALGQIRGDFARYAGTQALLSPPGRRATAPTQGRPIREITHFSAMSSSSGRTTSIRSPIGSWAQAPGMSTAAPIP